MGKKIIIDFFKEHKLTYALGFAFMFLTSYIQTLFPKVLGDTIDILKVKGFNDNDVYSNLLKMLFIAAAVFATTYAWRNFIIGNARKMECTIRSKLFEHFEKMSPQFYNKRKTGDLIAYGINDINAVRMAFGPATARAVNGVAICLITIYAMVRTINWKITLISLAPIPFVVLMMIKISIAVRKKFKIVQENFASISDRVDENINGIRVIKAYVQEDSEVERFEKLNEKMADSNIDMVKTSSYMSPLIEAGFTISFIINLIVGGNMVLSNEITLGSFIAFNGYITMIMSPVISIGRIVNIIQRGIASLHRLNEIFDSKVDIVDDMDAVDSEIKGKITIKNLTFSYPETDSIVLDKINLDIHMGSTIGVIGKTGSGKSTIAGILLRMYDVPYGTVYIDSIDIRKYKLDTLRNSIGFVPQDNFLFKASIYDNIKFFNDDYTDEEVVEAAKNADIYDSIMKFEDKFETVLGERGINISGGQKQRIAIARSLIRNTPILILDDSLSAVDTITESHIMHSLKKLRKDKTNIVIAHRISAVMHADKIIVIDGGKIAEEGTHDELVEKGGIYYDIYKSQCRERESQLIAQ